MVSMQFHCKYYGMDVISCGVEEKLSLYCWPIIETLLDWKYHIGVFVLFGRLIPEKAIKCFPLLDFNKIFKHI